MLGGKYYGQGVKLVRTRYSRRGSGADKIFIMWTWFVFVVSSASCVHLGYEMARRLRPTTGCATNPLER